ncbi:class I SAM-dependent methyltransferase [Methylocystis parvus]|uniref:Class I SAM-dependent methyltransferase n=1 Tax=Methylocystis parvus TaxID=134 RepID=A0A6B8MD98_9HYPH|nr:class I SAM-dependent methyltransferase [Methylocystis parvus]QGM99283.1 class I SAM-dependent methyltransferase [Methylocystis parvus]WBK00330.1 class I SAM-dependent methyltransferase [Methylocystis parvus OBBP]
MNEQQSTQAPDLGVLHDYEYQIDLNGDNALAYVVELAGAGKKILELGAGAGMQTQFLVKDKRNEVVAVEINPQSVEKLKRFTERVYSLDLNAPGWPDALDAEGKFDAIIAADVLEHLYDPWTAITEMKKLLKEDGEIIVSLPYIGNGAILGLLYEDDFDYREEGLLDKTHIRFFGLKNIEALHKNAGLTIADARIVLRRPEVTEFHASWNKLPKAVRAALTVSPHADIYQVVTTARRSETVATDFSLFDAAAKRCPPRRRTFLQRMGEMLLGL